MPPLSTDSPAAQAYSTRLRFLACGMLVAFGIVWIGWFAPFDDWLDGSGTPLGADFSMFYVAGWMVLEGRGEQLYDLAAQQADLQALFPGLDPQFALPYRYPPFVAVLMAGLAWLPYPVAFGAFFVLSVGCWWAALWLLTRDGSSQGGSAWGGLSRGTILLVACGWPVAIETLVGGQASMIAVLLIAATVVLLRQGRDATAGAVLALAAYKPNVLLLVGLGVILARPRMLRGAIPVAATLGLLSLWPAGWQGIVEYAGLSGRLATDSWDLATPYWKVHGIVPWLTAVFGPLGRVLGLIVGALATIAIAWRWRSLERATPGDGRAMSAAVALLITLNALLNPYTPIYDLTLLAVGLLLYPGDRLPTYLATAVFYFGPHLSQTIARPLGWQPFALAVLGLAVWQGRRLLALGDERNRVAARVQPQAHAPSASM